MANYCSNVLTIKSESSSLVDEFVKATTPPKRNFVSKVLNLQSGHKYGLLDFLKPMPDDLRETITNGYSGSEPEWRKWMVEHWGCAYDMAMDSTIRKSENEVQFKFHSMYAPPLEALNFGATNHGFSFRLVYCETGNQFAGIATEKDHKQFEFTFEVHPLEEGVPQEIIDEFELESIFDEVKADEGR